MLADGMRKLNGGLVVIASASGWPLTTVGEGTCAVFVGDRPVALCSESEKWRSQASIQMTLGAITGSKAVVLGSGRHPGRQQPRGVGGSGQQGCPKVPKWRYCFAARERRNRTRRGSR